MWLLIALIVTAALDLVTTAWAIRLGGVEASPLAAPLMKIIGLWPAMLAIKVAGIALAWWLAANVNQGWIFGAVLAALGVGVVLWNVRMIRRLKRA